MKMFKYLMLFFLFALFVLGFFYTKQNVLMIKSAINSPKGILYFSNGESIERINLENKVRETLIKGEEGKRGNSVWPVYNHKNNQMYFFRSYIWPQKCEFVIYDLENSKIEKTMNFCGTALSISPNGDAVAYYGKHNSSTGHNKFLFLAVRNLSKNQEEIIVEDVDANSEPPTWLSDRELIYANDKSQYIDLNIETKQRNAWRERNLDYLSALSLDKLQLAAIRSFPFLSQIFLIDPNGNKINKTINSFFLIGQELIWALNGRAFIYTRHDWKNLISFREAGNLYWYHLETGEEIKLADNIALFGGFWLDEDPAQNKTGVSHDESSRVN